MALCSRHNYYLDELNVKAKGKLTALPLGIWSYLYKMWILSKISIFYKYFISMMHSKQFYHKSQCNCIMRMDLGKDIWFLLVIAFIHLLSMNKYHPVPIRYKHTLHSWQNVIPYHVEFIFGTWNIFAFSIISQHRTSINGWNHCCKTPGPICSAYSYTMAALPRHHQLQHWPCVTWISCFSTVSCNPYILVNTIPADPVSTCLWSRILADIKYVP